MVQVSQTPAIMMRLLNARDEAERKAIDNLARYKFYNFGYWAGQWVKLNRIIGDKKPSPFKELVLKARDMRESSNENSS